MEIRRPGDRLILFSRFPIPGRAKTRLIPVLGPGQAAALQREMTAHTVRAARCLSAMTGASLEVRCDGATASQMQKWLGAGLHYQSQGAGDLGQRMERAFGDAFAAGAERVVVIGSDSPDLDARVLREAFASLDEADLVLGPARDGGYYLMGLRRLVPELFRGVAWGTHQVLAQTMALAGSLGLRHDVLEELDDVDRPEDLPVWERTRRRASALAVILPALNEAEQLRATMPVVMAGLPDEVVVVDGGSADETVDVARSFGATVVESARGRGRQMNVGARASAAGQLLFLHADTVPPAGYRRIVNEILNRPEVSAGAFGFSIREPLRGRSLVQGLVSARCLLLRMPFGDQGLFVRRELFEAIGGYADWPLLEDVEVLGRLKRHGRMRIATEAAATSGRRWLSRGVWSTLWLNTRILCGYYAGVPVERLARLYRSMKNPG